MTTEETVETDNNTQVEASQNDSGQTAPGTGSEEDLSTTERLMRKQAQEGDAAQDGDAASNEQDKAEEGDSESSEEAGAPENYEDFKMPDGGVDLGESVIAGIRDVAKELDLPQEKAQKLVDSMSIAHKQQMEAMRQQWIAAAKTDEEIGGTKLEESLTFAKKAVKQFGSDEFQKLLNDPSVGVGDMPEVIRTFARIGKAISDDKVHTGAPRQPSTENNRSHDARVLFDQSLAD